MHCLHASMEPRFDPRKTLRVGADDQLGRLASMEPRFDPRKTPNEQYVGTLRDIASMEPRFDPRKTPSPTKPILKPCQFDTLASDYRRTQFLLRSKRHRKGSFRRLCRMEPSVRAPPGEIDVTPALA